MVIGAVSAMAAKQAERLKEDGNSCFKKERFGAAIDAYTEVYDSHYLFHFPSLISSLGFLLSGRMPRI